jgi:predicted 2-oxoglutarate/Fe(II)-dependent dioxygenase YbiX
MDPVYLGSLAQEEDMTISRPKFPAPIIVIDDFLTAEHAAECLQEAIDLRPVYMPARVGFGADNRQDNRIRTNEVVHLDAVFAAAPDRSSILRLVKQRIVDPDCNQLWHEGDYIFDIANYATWKESVLSRYGEDAFYEAHQDTVRSAEHPEAITRRLVTLCYYLQREPAGYSGGEITIHKSNRQISIAPRHNRAVVFPSFCYHQVGPVKMHADEWSNARFSVNLWMGFR